MRRRKHLADPKAFSQTSRILLKSAGRQRSKKKHWLLSSLPLDSGEPDIFAVQQDQTKEDINEAGSVRENDELRLLIQKLDAEEKRNENLLTEKGAIAWLNGLPLEKHGLWLEKGDFRYALCL